jgi:hypothetical protein
VDSGERWVDVGDVGGGWRGQTRRALVLGHNWMGGYILGASEERGRPNVSERKPHKPAFFCRSLSTLCPASLRPLPE